MPVIRPVPAEVGVQLPRIDEYALAHVQRQHIPVDKKVHAPAEHAGELQIVVPMRRHRLPHRRAPRKHRIIGNVVGHALGAIAQKIQLLLHPIPPICRIVIEIQRILMEIPRNPQYNNSRFQVAAQPKGASTAARGVPPPRSILRSAIPMKFNGSSEKVRLSPRIRHFPPLPNPDLRSAPRTENRSGRFVVRPKQKPAVHFCTTGVIPSEDQISSKTTISAASPRRGPILMMRV